jgi:hypothetical protein
VVESELQAWVEVQASQALAVGVAYLALGEGAGRPLEATGVELAIRQVMVVEA